ncbi:hypothetical protein [Nostoc sp. TCL26-01]|uniref:hypothetical protein n=1 Tax=Nostoc sp. TCL26-01 TaxID=2576904 RepID=UPI0015B8BA03|nr:hypothetical protein [Nostoc sp. TCL26-01]QLE58387.1 hypothetical protein FD725_24465 [Nostoc sp. TCL26-01]
MQSKLLPRRSPMVMLRLCSSFYNLSGEIAFTTPLFHLRTRNFESKGKAMSTTMLPLRINN